MRDAVIIETHASGYGLESFGVRTRSFSNVTPGLYLLVPVSSEEEALKLAKWLSDKSEGSR